jgi:hypothetical protein
MAHEQASRSGKAQTGGRCVFTGLAGTDGAHWYPAGDFTLLADVPENIFAMERNHHSVRGKPCFDWTQVDGVDVVRPVAQRRWMLENLTLDEFRAMVHKKIRVVGLYCNAHDIEFPEAEKPADYEALIYQGRLA